VFVHRRCQRGRMHRRLRSSSVPTEFAGERHLCCIPAAASSSAWAASNSS
jgi:hypothetical protein